MILALCVRLRLTGPQLYIWCCPLPAWPCDIPMGHMRCDGAHRTSKRHLYACGASHINGVAPAAFSLHISSLDTVSFFDERVHPILSCV